MLACHRSRVIRPEISTAVTALGLLALWARTPGIHALALTAAAGAAGLPFFNLENPVSRAPKGKWLVIAIGCSVFAMSRMFGPAAVLSITAFAVFANSFAAICEEAFFRRFLYSRLERFGPAAAIAVTASLFALIHIPAYGWPVVPLDFAAGLLLGWQRWASGSWAAPAATHLFANLVSMIR